MKQEKNKKFLKNYMKNYKDVRMNKSSFKREEMKQRMKRRS